MNTSPSQTIYRGLSLAAAIATRQTFTSAPRYRDCASKYLRPPSRTTAQRQPCIERPEQRVEPAGSSVAEMSAGREGGWGRPAEERAKEPPHRYRCGGEAIFNDPAAILPLDPALQ